MKILAFDTALFGCSAGVFDARSGALAAKQEPMPRGQAERLVPMVLEVLAQAGLEFKDIDLVATTVGPGAFTGLRIGLAAAQGFGLALRKPVAGLVTTEVLAAHFFEKETLSAGQRLGVVIETKRQDYYCQFFKADGSAQTEPEALSGEEVLAAGQGAVFIGDALGRLATDGDFDMREGFELPDPGVMARLALAQYEAGAIRPPEPLYLRDADVSKSKKVQRTILEE